MGRLIYLLIYSCLGRLVSAWSGILWLHRPLEGAIADTKEQDIPRMRRCRVSQTHNHHTTGLMPQDREHLVEAWKA